MRQQTVGITDDEALETPPDLKVGKLLRPAPLDVGIRPEARPNPVNRDDMQRPDRPSVATAVGPAANGPVARGLHRRGSAERSEQGLRAHPLQVVTCGHRKGGGREEAAAVHGGEHRVAAPHGPGDPVLQVLCLGPNGDPLGAKRPTG